MGEDLTAGNFSCCFPHRIYVGLKMETLMQMKILISCLMTTDAAREIEILGFLRHGTTFIHFGPNSSLVIRLNHSSNLGNAQTDLCH